MVLMYVVAFASYAQNSKAYFDTKTTKQKLNDNTVAYTFQVDNIPTEKQVQQLEKKFRSSSSVLEVKGQLVPEDKARYVVSVEKPGNRETLQRMLIEAGINMVNIDGVDVETSKSVEYANSLKAKQRRHK